MIINLNGELHLEETLSSINKQSHHDIEVVLVDGGSSDSSVSVFEGYNFHEGISKLLIENNNEANITESFKMGGQQSTGKYIYQLCSDDLLFDTDWLKVACHTLDKHRDIGAVWGRTLIMRDAKEIIIGSQIFCNAWLDLMKIALGVHVLAASHHYCNR